MMEYVATGHANLAWIAAKDGETALILENANRALEIWAGLALAYPFQSLALWPLIELGLKQELYQEAFDHVRLLLRPEQQKFTDRLTDALQKAISDWEEGRQIPAIASLKNALEIAREEFQN